MLVELLFWSAKKKVKCCSNVNEGFVTPAANRAGEELRS